ncbi:hypothetical protein TYRP_007058 [Tyrophagus putrescentiae]|nr:hypothetical protein TYRP_007058 [Tyrophagus putrescentiae]
MAMRPFRALDQLNVSVRNRYFTGFLEKKWPLVSAVQVAHVLPTRMSSLSKYSRDLPDLCLLAVVSQMTAEDRINAHRVCPQWCHRVREVNRVTVPSLTIAVAYCASDAELFINYLDVGNIASVRLLTNADGSPQYPLHRLTKGNSLKFEGGQLNSAVVKQITSSFSGITELIFVTHINKYLNQKRCHQWRGKMANNFLPVTNDNDFLELSHLVEMLVDDRFKNQLTSLKVFVKDFKNGCNREDFRPEPLFDAINSLPKLKYLTLKLSFSKIPDLPILAQLKKVTIAAYNKIAFLHSLEQYAVHNTEGLQVEIQRGCGWMKELNNVNPSLRSRICRLEKSPISVDYLHSVGTNFPNLTSLTVRLNSTDCPKFLSSLSQLRQLFHLGLEINFYRKNAPQVLSPRPSTPLTSVKVLSLGLKITTHRQLPWLNLPVIVPNVQAIDLGIISCRFCPFQIFIPVSPKQKVFGCLRAHLRFLHKFTGLPAHRLKYFGDTKSCFSYHEDLGTIEDMLRN